MAASASDLLMEVGTPGTATTLSSPGYTQGNTTISIGSTSGWPTATGTIFAIDRAEVVDGEEVRIEGTYCEFAGSVASGTSVENLSLVFGTPQDYATGALTRVYIPVSSERENRIVEWGLGHADQDGTLKAGAVDNASVLAANVVETAKILDGAATPEKRSGGYVTGNFTRTTNGTYVVSGIANFDFTPKIIRFSTVFGHNAATSNVATMSVGTYCAANGLNQSVTTTVRADGGAGNSISTTACIRIITTSSGGIGAEAGTASVTAVGNGTFTLSFLNVDSTGLRVIWEAEA